MNDIHRNDDLTRVAHELLTNVGHWDSGYPGRNAYVRTWRDPYNEDDTIIELYDPDSQIHVRVRPITPFPLDSKGLREWTMFLAHKFNRYYCRRDGSVEERSLRK
jgi:hypothetical protein